MWIDLNTCSLLPLPPPLTWKIHIQCSSEPLLKVSRNIFVTFSRKCIRPGTEIREFSGLCFNFPYLSVAFTDQNSFPDYQISIFLLAGILWEFTYFSFWHDCLFQSLLLDSDLRFTWSEICKLNLQSNYLIWFDSANTKLAFKWTKKNFLTWQTCSILTISEGPLGKSCLKTHYLFCVNRLIPWRKTNFHNSLCWRPWEILLDKSCKCFFT